MASDSRPDALDLAEDPPTRWLGLQVKHTETMSEFTATVEFVAHYKIGGKAARMHELSQFVRIESRWYYLSGNQLIKC